MQIIDNYKKCIEFQENFIKFANTSPQSSFANFHLVMSQQSDIDQILTDKDASTANTTPEYNSHPKIDKHIWGIYIALVVISLVELYSASSREITAGHIFSPLVRHIIHLGMGFVIMLCLQRVHYMVFKRLTWWIVGLSIVAAIYTMFFGDIINGARRSFSIGMISIQPSELLKFSSALLIARVIADFTVKENGRSVVKDKAVKIIAIAILVFSGLLVNQGLTNTLLLMAISLSMLLIGGVKWKSFLIVIAVYAALGGCYFLYSQHQAKQRDKIENKEGMPYQTNRTRLRGERLKNFFKDHLTDTITTENQQAQYSFIAQANGKIFGVGPGNSRETARLPLAFSDYIYAIVIEDMGLIGGLFILALYLFLLARAGRVGLKCESVYPALLIIGMAVFIVFQALFHMAIVTGVFPVSGQPLPFISKGGSAVLICSVALGIMLSVSRFAQRKDENTD